jgi:hypothetical protein
MTRCALTDVSLRMEAMMLRAPSIIIRNTPHPTFRVEVPKPLSVETNRLLIALE